MNKYILIYKKTNQQTRKANQRALSRNKEKKYKTAKEKNSNNNICTQRLLFVGHRSLVKNMHFTHFRNFANRKELKSKGETAPIPFPFLMVPLI